MRLVAAPLTADAFAPFGDVLEGPFTLGRVAADRSLESRRSDLPLSLSLVLKPPSPLPIASTTMERHPVSSQSFIPMDAGRWLAVVAPRDARGGPDMSNAKAFLARPGQGITYGADVWHHPFTVLDRPGLFAVLAWKTGTPEDDVFVEVPSFQIDLA